MEKAKFTLRLERSVLNKLQYISSKHFRTINKEVEMLIIRYIEDYEKKNGLISQEDHGNADG